MGIKEGRNRSEKLKTRISVSKYIKASILFRSHIEEEEEEEKAKIKEKTR